jgi:formylglycine-generating enzyme
MTARDPLRPLGIAVMLIAWCGPNALFAAPPVMTQPPPAPAEAPEIVPCASKPAGMACVSGGAFWRGSDDGPKNTRPKASIWLQTFYMDVYEVTVEAYDACVAGGACKPAKTAYSDFSRPRQPKVGINWYLSKKFCEVSGKHLPTEAEWEKAARGTDGRLYPWGDEPATCERAIIMDERGRSCGVKKQGGEPDKGRTFEVGTLAPNTYGLYDMAGNSWEWIADWYSKSYRACGKACTGFDPKGPCGGREPCEGYEERLVRGGSWYWPAEYSTTIHRRPHAPQNKPYHHFGFRCAASVAEAAALPQVPASSPTPAPSPTPTLAR